MFFGMLFNDLQKSPRGVAECSLAAENQTQLALHLQFRDGNGHQGASGQLCLYSEPGDECDTVTKLHEALNGL